MNIAWRINWYYRTSVFEELEIFHRKNVYERYANGTEEMKKQTFNHIYNLRMDWWNQQSKIEARTIAKNPTERNAQTRMEQLKKKPDCTPIIFEAMVNYLKNQFEHILDLGHTEAYSFLCNIFEPKFLPVLEEKLITPTPFETFEFSGDINHFFKQCVDYKVIDSKTSLDSFKMAFDGSETYETNFIDFICKNTTFICFITLLNDNDLLNNYPSNFHQVAEKISGKKNLKVSLSTWKKFGTFKMEEEINELIKSLK
tara:strand:- start:82 stop:849 length:768 start_codon:yes stop_codon:yes gene_type:complete